MIACPECWKPFEPSALDGAEFVACARCATPFRLRLFPAALRRAEATAAAAATAADASCFFHAENRAVVPCAGCGRFLCALCDLELAGRHLCPACASSRAASPTEERFVRERTLWDSVALALAVYPMLIFYFTLVTAPASIFVAIRHWRTPGSLLRRTRARFVIAFVVAAAQVLGWMALLVFLVVAVGRAAEG